MTLAAQTWTHISFHKVVLAWLRAERGTRLAGILAQLPPALWMPGLGNLLDRADLGDPDENRARLRLLYFYRYVVLVEIPPDTEWFEVTHLSDSDLNELYVVNSQDWTDPADKNELSKVAARRYQPLRSPPSSWEPLILIGHDRSGPFTIVEGNNRPTAYAAGGQTGLHVPVMVGLSPLKCLWNIFDECAPLMQDLIVR